jgi:alpha,alpha-trehalose-phosphate synthase [UDP-forming]/trehalose-phosphatase
MADFLRYLQDCKFILVSNREPYEHVRGPRGVEVRQPAGGLVSALDPTLRRTHGTWVAWGSGSADRDTSDESGRIQVPPGEESYTLRRVWLESAEVEAYYDGFANRSLWPLCHMLIHHFEYRAEYWERYRDVNLRFAHAAADEAERCAGRSSVWIQDYHFALAPEFLRGIRPNLFIHQFWHIPFPPPDILRLLPGGSHVAVLRGMLGNDLVEFQTSRHAENFLDCVDEFVSDAIVDAGDGIIRRQDRAIHVGAFPISVDFEKYDEMARSEKSTQLASTLRTRYARGTRQLGVCVDRVDYTKGIPERLRALELLWSENPALRGRITFLFVCTPSRSNLPAYTQLELEVAATVQAINTRYGTDDWTPIVLVGENVDSDLLSGVYRAADICLVSSLQDGMNLVAKEFVASQVDERGVLLLSRFTGAAEDLEGSVLINPFNIDGFMSAIQTALHMPAEERRRRMRRMRRRLNNNTIFDWLDGVLARSADIMDLPPPSTDTRGRALNATSAEVEGLVDRIAGRLDGTPLAVMLDLDGTLAPIAPTPAHATVSIATRNAVQALTTLPGVTVALVTGRSAQDAQRLAGLRDAWTIGNHGLEVLAPDGSTSAPADAREFEKVVDEAAGRLASRFPIPGALIENKRLTLSLHYRLVDPALVPELLSGAKAIADELGLRITEGRKVLEMRPPIEINKGTATREFASRLGALGNGGSVFYAGDDRTDEDAFRELRCAGARAVTVRIAPADERPRETSAELTLASPDALRELLQWLAARRGRA